MPRKAKKVEKKQVKERGARKVTRTKKNRIPNEVFLGAAVVLIIVAAVFLLAAKPSAQLSSEEVSERLVDWLKAFFAGRGMSVDINVLSVADRGSVYEVNVLLLSGGRGERATYYVSKDGRFFFPMAIDITKAPQTQAQPRQQATVPKSDRPVIELFVMSYCPYGIQMEKAMIPVLRLLGDKVDFTLRFVNYAMHGEKEVWENVRQRCIQREYGVQKLLDYLECFNITNPKNYEACMAKVGIDVNRINACVEEINREYNIAEILKNPASWGSRFPPFPLDDQENIKYGVRGSPTLVINGTVVTVQRSPEAVKQVICAAFNSPPAECNTTLSNEVPSPGFGGGTGGSTASAQCG